MPKKKKKKRERILLVDHPAWAAGIGAEWDWEKNDARGLRPDQITHGSGIFASWKCPICGCEWEAMIGNRTRGKSLCPDCLAKVRGIPLVDHPSWKDGLSKEWDWEKNEERGLKPDEITFGSPQVAAWCCPICGCEWEAMIGNRTRGKSLCPDCLAKVRGIPLVDHPSWKDRLADEWDWKRNEKKKLRPDEVTFGSPQVAAWKCPTCGCRWNAGIGNRTRRKYPCPKCSSSSSMGELDATTWARANGFVVEGQWKTAKCCDKRPLPFDLMLYAPVGNALMEIALVEYDGEQHSNPKTQFAPMVGTEPSYDYIRRHDGIKNAFCEATGRILVRVPYTVRGVEKIGIYIETELRKHGLYWWFDGEGDKVV